MGRPPRWSGKFGRSSRIFDRLYRLLVQLVSRNHPSGTVGPAVFIQAISRQVRPRLPLAFRGSRALAGRRGACGLSRWLFHLGLSGSRRRGSVVSDRLRRVEQLHREQTTEQNAGRCRRGGDDHRMIVDCVTPKSIRRSHVRIPDVPRPHHWVRVGNASAQAAVPREHVSPIPPSLRMDSASFEPANALNAGYKRPERCGLGFLSLQRAGTICLKVITIW